MTTIEPTVVVARAEDFASSAAEAIAVEIELAISTHGHCRLGLAGGSTPRSVYQRLARRAEVQWAQVTVLWGDERAVGPQDPASNYRMAQEALLDHVQAGTVTRIEGELPAPEARRRYEDALGTAPLDVLLLGMGGDGHTASLFPGSDMQAAERVVLSHSPIPPDTRISLSMRAINEARAIVVLVRGADKAERVAEVFDQMKRQAPELPAAFVAPGSRRLVWLLDSGAASVLPQNEAK